MRTFGGDLWQCSSGSIVSRRHDTRLARGNQLSAAGQARELQVTQTASPSNLPDMSSDPFADLASSVEVFAKKFRDFMTRNPRPAPGSPADQEARGEPFAGDWSDHPSSDIFATTYLAADVLNSRNALFAAYTLTRGAVEAAALGCYLTDQDIDGRERVRRTMNYRLDAMCERVWLFRDMPDDFAADRLAEARQWISDVARSARQHGFDFHDMGGKGHAAHVGPEQPKAMTLISLAVNKNMPELGRTYQRLLSATAHSAVHGLARMQTPVSPNEGRPGEALAAVNIDPSKTRRGVGCWAADRAPPRERRRVVHAMRHERPRCPRDPDAQDMSAYRPDERADGECMTQSIPRATDLANLVQAAPRNALAQRSGNRWGCTCAWAGYRWADAFAESAAHHWFP
jgi:hypothetical protein